ncbi:DUF559 domain-containing protein [Alloscardovia omnicolens]|uniref:DUF559 domain-containing protein n=1 Tax=Alloscardovia omnicolens TaxID=419015 RepID=UPI003A5F6B28
MENSKDLIIVLKGHTRKTLHVNHVDIMRSVGMRSDCFTPDTPDWQIRDAVNLARIYGTYATSKNIAYFTHESSMILHGISPWNPSPPVCAHVTKQGNKRILKPVSIYNCSIAQSQYYPIRSSFIRHDVNIVSGVPAESLSLTCLRMALTHPLIDGIAAVSQMLHVITEFSRHNMDASRTRERKIKESLLSMLEEERTRRPFMSGYKHAKSIIENADAACETLGEAVLQPIVAALFPPQYASQFNIAINGHNYYTDFAVLGLHLIIEFDGTRKMGRTEEEFLEARQYQLNRQSALESLGYSFIRVRWNELMNLRALYYRILRSALTKRPDFHVQTNPLKQLLEADEII